MRRVPWWFTASKLCGSGAHRLGLAARWNTRSQPSVARATVAGSVIEPTTCSTPSMADSAGRRSSTRTCSPRATSAATRCRPMKPHPPVTRLRRTKPPFAGRKAAARCAGTMRASQIRVIGLAAAIALLCFPAWAHERPTTTPAARFLQDNIERALVLAKPPVSRKSGDELDILIRDAMDWPNLTQYAVGHYGVKLDAGGLSEVGAQLERQLGLLARRAGKEMPALTIALRGLRIDADGSRHVFSTADVPRFGEI